MRSNRFKIPPHMEEWFIENYPNTMDKVLADSLGCCTNTVWRLAKERGLTKSPEHLELIEKRRRRLANEANRLHPNNAFIEAGKKHQFKKGVTNLERYGKELNEKRKKKIAVSYTATLRKEQARAAFGLKQKTAIRIGKQDPKRANVKWYLRRRGYRVDDKTRTVYYGPETRRGLKAEAKNSKYYQFKPEEQ